MLEAVEALTRRGLLVVRAATGIRGHKVHHRVLAEVRRDGNPGLLVARVAVVLVVVGLRRRQVLVVLLARRRRLVGRAEGQQPVGDAREEGGRLGAGRLRVREGFVQNCGTVRVGFSGAVMAY